MGTGCSKSLPVITIAMTNENTNGKNISTNSTCDVPDSISTVDCTVEDDLYSWLSDNFGGYVAAEAPPMELEPYKWKEVHIYISSTRCDTHAERDAIVKRVIPRVNRKIAGRYIRVIPIDLRWGLSKEDTKDTYAIQRTCFSLVDQCRTGDGESPWFIGLGTERHGRIQKDILENGNNWLSELRAKEKRFSMTGLEWVYAAIPPTIRRIKSTMFIYRRNILNRHEIEPEYKWIFDFDHIMEDVELDETVKYQYRRSSKANEYAENKRQMEKGFQELDHIKYTRYNCTYEKGNSHLTAKREGKRNLGIGYVSGLEEFEMAVEEDLMAAIEENFKEADVSDIPGHILQSMPHENYLREKGSVFVGQSETYERCAQHFTSDTAANSTMIVHGNSGCGKSDLLGALLCRCLDDMRQNGHFVFVHAVGSCPDSNTLQGMLKRLEACLIKYCSSLGNGDVTEYCKTDADLKRTHPQRLEELARKYPEKRFAILIDGANRFDGSFGSWNMWWLVTDDAPGNLRCIIGTLNKENGTFENSCKMSPNALKVELADMSYDDTQKLVENHLWKYHKKLTTDDDDPILGNQMRALLGKNLSPKYLVAATAAIRTFGVYEKLSEYINSFPTQLPDLFTFLLKQWSKEYGTVFVRDVVGLLTVARDGLLDSEMDDILAFIERDEGFSYGSSFDHFYYSLDCFLAEQGRGYLKFTHGDLKKVVRDQFAGDLETKLHTRLACFYLEVIQPQLCMHPKEIPPPYYFHCLQEIIYHLMQLRRLTGKTIDFSSTLRNVYYVRERVKINQGQALYHDYINVIREGFDNNDAIRQWATFAQLYSPYISKFPWLAHNMALNQSPSSYVAMDTCDLKDADGQGYRYHWSNRPTAEDSVVLKYTSASVGCCTASTKKNLIAVGGKGKVYIYEKDSGAFINEVDVEGHITSLYLSDTDNKFWAGSMCGYASVWDIDRGRNHWKKKVLRGKHRGAIIWLDRIGDQVVCGTGHEKKKVRHSSTADMWVTMDVEDDDDQSDDHDQCIISMFNAEDKSRSNTWVTGMKCYCYCFHAQQNSILSGHDEVVKCWNLQGDLLRNIEAGFGYKVKSISVSAEKGLMAVSAKVSEPEEFEYCVCLVDISSDGESSTRRGTVTIPDACGFAKFDSRGDRVCCLDETRKNVFLYGIDGRLRNVLEGHSNVIMDACLIAESESIITAADDGSVLFDLPEEPDPIVYDKVHDRVAAWCEFLPCGTKYVVLTKYARSMNKDCKLELWSTNTDILPIRIYIPGGKHGALQPDGQHVAVSTWDGQLHLFRTEDLDEVSMRNVDETRLTTIQFSPGGDNVITRSKYILFWLRSVRLASWRKDSDDSDHRSWITDVKFSPDGMKLIAVTKNLGAFVFSTVLVQQMAETAFYQMQGDTWTCDIHEDNLRAISGGSCGVDMWNIITGGKEKTLLHLLDSDQRAVKYVKFLCKLDNILYVDATSRIHMLDMSGSLVRTLDSQVSLTSPTLVLFDEECKLITAESDTSIRLHDLRSGDVVYTFVDHGSAGFLSFAVHPDGSMILARNRNGLLYILEASPDKLLNKIEEERAKANIRNSMVTFARGNLATLKRRWLDKR